MLFDDSDTQGTQGSFLCQVHSTAARRRHHSGCWSCPQLGFLSAGDRTQASHTLDKHSTSEHASPGLPLLTSNPEVLVNNPDLSARTWRSAVSQYKAGSRELSFRPCPGDLMEHWLPFLRAQQPQLIGTVHAICKSAQHCNVLYCIQEATQRPGGVQETSGVPNTEFQS